MFFTSTILLEYGIKGLKTFLLPTAFLGMIGVIYTIDNLYPNGRFTPFQILVPTTAKLATYVLEFMGYRTRIAPNTSMNMPYVAVFDQNGNPHGFYIAWPCSGVESLLIYTLTILLFFKETAVPWKHRIIYFIIGAIITYFINILRIVTIFIIAANNGDVWTFHDYYAQLYSVTWIMSYPLVSLYTQSNNKSEAPRHTRMSPQHPPYYCSFSNSTNISVLVTLLRCAKVLSTLAMGM